jgi:Amt family ammonium transporter
MIGFLTCIICYGAVIAFKEYSDIDDSLDVFTIHGVAGTCGVFFTGYFCSKDVNPTGPNGLVYGHGMTLGKHIAVILVSIPLIMISSYIICIITNAIIPLRVSEDDEKVGLDMAMHNESLHDVLHKNKNVLIPTDTIVYTNNPILFSSSSSANLSSSSINLEFTNNFISMNEFTNNCVTLNKGEGEELKKEVEKESTV